MDDLQKLRLLLDEYGYAPGVELGDCMNPAMRRGDKVLVEKAGARELNVGDVAVFQTQGALYAHRVVGRVELGGEFFLITKGDVEGFLDRPVPARRVLGRVSGRGRSVSGIRMPLAYLLLAVHYVSRRVGLGLAYRYFSRCVSLTLR